ncbi:unnamed protein product [Linum trigynum]|uniref:Kinesin-like protein n=1 Tax=Linum trigynum TaxID=586398 RepID=A0AAV2CH88_9ROSI
MESAASPNNTVPENSPANPTMLDDPSAPTSKAQPVETIKFFVRIKPSRSDTGDISILAEDSHSVTISPSPLPEDQKKKSKPKVHKGFAHVFTQDSSQNEVYVNMVQPMVDDLLQGRSGMLVALGPSDSGKSHTLFGTLSEPGMFPLALQQILDQSRSFYLSIFEIYSDSGMVENIRDLIPEELDFAFEITTQGVREVVVPNAKMVSTLIASAISKRATTTTNSYNQSSRAHCIVTVRMAVDQRAEVSSGQSGDARLTIVDLAGAERGNRTEIQGADLPKSNFINNVPMIIDLCCGLRGFLGHQKNPQEPLQKHCQLSMLLTVKPTVEDYLDTACLLTQVSRYLKSDEYPSVIEMADWKWLPSTLPKKLAAPTSRSLFFEIFKRVPDTFFWMIVSLLCYGGHIYLFRFTRLHRDHLHPQWGWIFVAFLLGLLIVAFFLSVSKWRKGCILRRRYGYIAKTVGFFAGVLLSSSYIWLGESSANYCFFLLLLIIILTVAFLAIRPSTDFNVVNGLMTSLITYTLRVMKNQLKCYPHCHEDTNLDYRRPFPYIIIVGCIIVVLLRNYFESRALKADEEAAERAGAARNKRDPGCGEWIKTVCKSKKADQSSASNN